MHRFGSPIGRIHHPWPVLHAAPRTRPSIEEVQGAFPWDMYEEDLMRHLGTSLAEVELQDPASSQACFVVADFLANAEGDYVGLKVGATENLTRLRAGRTALCMTRCPCHRSTTWCTYTGAHCLSKEEPHACTCVIAWTLGCATHGTSCMAWTVGGWIHKMMH